MHHWDWADIADALARGFERRIARDTAEQAVSGIDALGEVQLHALCAQAVGNAGFGVHREQRFPADRSKRRISHGRRCDLVLTPRGRSLEKEASHATLFDADDAVPFAQAAWIETKLVRQFIEADRPAGYAAQLMSVVASDVAKLCSDPGIAYAALLIIMFTSSNEAAHHDLNLWLLRCEQQVLPVLTPHIRLLPIEDRIGHGCCTLALCPLVCGSML